MEKQLNLIVLSRNPRLYSTQRIRAAGQKMGHHVTVLDHTKCDIIIDRNAPQVYYRGKEIKEVDAIIPRIGSSVTFYGAAVVRQFEAMGVFSATTSKALTQSRDKLQSLQILSAAGLGMPKTAFTNYSRDVNNVINQVGGVPCILKLLEGSLGLGVVLTETISSARSVLEAFNGLEARILVQEFIKEAKGADIRALVVDGTVVGAMKRQGKEGEFRSNLHRGGTAILSQLTEQEEEVALAAVEALGLGIAGVDLLQSDYGPLIIEVNASPGLEGIERATKQDIASTIIRYVERHVYS